MCVLISEILFCSKINSKKYFPNKHETLTVFEESEDLERCWMAILLADCSTDHCAKQTYQKKIDFTKNFGFQDLISCSSLKNSTLITLPGQKKINHHQKKDHKL